MERIFYNNQNIGMSLKKALAKMSFTLLLFGFILGASQVSNAQFSIGDFVFEDTNGNGIQDFGEMGLPGIQVNLYHADSLTLEGTTTTNVNGNFNFGNLPDTASYYLEFITPSYLHSTIADQGADDAVDSDITDAFGDGTTDRITPDNSGNYDAGFASCSSMSCQGALNIGLGNTCEVTINPYLILTDPQFDEAAYSVMIKDSNGNLLPSNTLGASAIGKTYEVIVVNDICGNSCWMNILIEDKNPPIMICDDVVTSCFANPDSFPIPNIEDNCGDATLILISEKFTALDCDSLYTGMYERTWTAVDEMGNEADVPCVQTVLLERVKLDSLIFPEHLMVSADNALECGSGYDTDSDGNPTQEVTGFPMIKTMDGDTIVIDTVGANAICNAYITYKDKLLPPIGCTIKLMRTYTVGEWFCGGTIDTVYRQIIEISDEDGPVFDPIADLTVSTSGNTCDAAYVIDLPEAMDDCCEDFSYSVNYPGGVFTEYTNQAIPLPIGVNTVELTVKDCCGNETTDEYLVTVQDGSAPTVICNEFINLGITSAGVTYLPATSVNNGSFDDCNEVTISIARMGETDFGPYIEFTCDDVGTSQMVVLKVSDGVNENTCMTEVLVQDKITPVLNCPADLDLPCNTPYNENDLISSFGDYDFTDNCNGDIEVSDVLTGQLDGCGEGILTRTITLTNADDEEIAQCTQRIEFIRDLAPPLVINFNAVGDFDLDNCPEEIVLGEPTWQEGLCDQVAYTVETDTFQFTDGACYKLVNHYTVINWCVYDPNDPNTGGIWTHTQIIKVSDSSEPVIEQRTDVVGNIASTEGDCIGDVTLTNSATDAGSANCVNGDLIWEITVDLNNDDFIDHSYTRVTASGQETSITIPDVDGMAGTHTVRWVVRDGCGNNDAVEYQFILDDTFRPTPYCQDISTAVMQEGGTVDIWAIDFNVASFDNCTAMEDLRYTFTSTPPENDPNYNESSHSSSMTFTCEDAQNSPVMVEMYVWDELGNSDFCIVELTIQDNFDVCPEPPIVNCECDPQTFTGWAVATCNTEHADEGHVGVIYDVRNTDDAPGGSDWGATLASENKRIYPENWTITEIGQVFGIAIDDEQNIYLAASDVYDTQFDTDPYSPGQIFKADPSNDFLAVPFVELPNSGGALNGIGNIVFDNESGILYASNLEDGRIYGIDEDGNIVAGYDPWALDDEVSGIARQAEQVWGLGLNREDGQKKLYFARIDGSTREMYSVTIDEDGNFPEFGNEVLEFSNIQGVRPRITDIAFNSTGDQMLFTERGTIFTEGAHDSKTLRYDLGSNGAWTMAIKYNVGGNVTNEFPQFDVDPGENSAGGVDFGSTTVNDTAVVGCDQIAWTTMNYYEFMEGTPDYELYYGMQGMNASGNSMFDLSDVAIDFDGAVGDFNQKGDIGDVEIFKCFEGTGARIAGRITTDLGASIEDVEVVLNANLPNYPKNDMTDSEGNFAFENIEDGEDFQLSVAKATDYMNGVSTVDLVMIQRHILQIQEIDSPYKLIAADINKDNKIKTSDLLALRKVILGVDANFPELNSWRFVGEDMTFNDEADPFAENLDNAYTLAGANGETTMDFIGVKVGDINGDVEMNVQAGLVSTNRNLEVTTFEANDRLVQQGQRIQIPFYASSDMDVAGLQLAIQLDNASFNNITSGVLAIDELDYTVRDNVMYISFANTVNDVIESGNSLFTIDIEMQNSQLISNTISISEKFFNAEVYLGDELTLSKVNFEFNDKVESENPFEMIGNRPNPWKNNTSIDFTIPEDGNVALSVMSSDGKVLYNSVQYFTKGKNSFNLTDSNVSGSGLMFIEIVYNKESIRSKMIKIK